MGSVRVNLATDGYGTWTMTPVEPTTDDRAKDASDWTEPHIIRGEN